MSYEHSTPGPSTIPLSTGINITTPLIMSTEDLRKLCVEVVKGVKQASTSTPPPPPPPQSNVKDLKFGDQNPFSGRPEDLDPMLREAELRFQIQDTIYNTADKKVYYILSLFKTGNAKLWKEQYVRQREGKTLCSGNDWNNFKGTLRASFRDVGSKEEAMTALQKITQGPRQSLDTLNTMFNT